MINAFSLKPCMLRIFNFPLNHYICVEAPKWSDGRTGGYFYSSRQKKSKMRRPRRAGRGWRCLTMPELCRFYLSPCASKGKLGMVGKAKSTLFTAIGALSPHRPPRLSLD
jgi:hypothetical protein